MDRNSWLETGQYSIVTLVVSVHIELAGVVREGRCGLGTDKVDGLGELDAVDIEAVAVTGLALEPHLKTVLILDSIHFAHFLVVVKDSRRPVVVAEGVVVACQPASQGPAKS